MEESLSTSYEEEPADPDIIQFERIDHQQPTSHVHVPVGSSGHHHADSSQIDDRHTANTASAGKTIVDDMEREIHYQEKLRSFWCSKLVWIRILIFSLSALLIVLSLSFAVAQMLTVELDIVTRCDGDTKNQTQIFEHSLAAGTAPNGEVLVTEQSQYGWSEEACWTTHQIEVNTDLLWKRNRYITSTQSVNIYSVFFSILTLYAVAVSVYIIGTIQSDIADVERDRLHSKSQEFAHRQTQFQSVMSDFK